MIKLQVDLPITGTNFSKILFGLIWDWSAISGNETSFSLLCSGIVGVFGSSVLWFSPVM